MREKRVNLVVLTCSVIVATCASLSYCVVTADSHVGLVEKYVGLISTAIPLFLSGQISPAAAKTEVWIPSEEAVDTDGSVTDEFAEVAHFFGRPEQKIVKPREEDEILQQPVPWTSLKNEWKIYNKIQASQRNKKPEDKLGKKKGTEQPAQDDDDGSSEEQSGEEDEEDDDEDDEPEARSGLGIMAEEAPGSAERKGAPAPAPPSKKGKKGNLPLAFFGQENHDDDEKDYQKEQQNLLKKGRNKSGKKDSDEEEDDTSSSKEAASLEDYADYAVDDDDDADEDGDADDEDKPKQQQKPQQNLGFDQIPLAIREMILNDLANQGNGTGYHPNLTPQVHGGQQPQPSSGEAPPPGGPQPPGSAESDDASGEDNSSEEEDEEEDDVAAAPNAPKLGESVPTPPAYRPTVKPKKGEDDEDDVFGEEEDGKKKSKGKGKKKKGKKGKGKGGWGKPQGWGPPPVIHHHGHPPKEHGWGWDPEKHDGVLEQLVRGSTWERVLKYYHWKRDQAVKGEGGPHHDDHHHDHHPEQPGLEFAGLLHPGIGWGEPEHGEHHHESGIKKVVKGAFKGSFWERAVKTYAQYKENQAKNPKKPTLLDLDADNLGLSVGH